MAVLLLSGAAAAAYAHFAGNIAARPVGVGGDRPRDSAARDYLLLGSDTRAGAAAAYANPGDEVDGARADTTLLLHLAPGAKKAVVVSFPRDLWVDLPACAPGGAHRGRFNSAFTAGGAGCTMQTVEQLTGIRLDDYLLVDFASFRDIVDALGGVPFCTPVPLSDPAVPRRGSTPGHGTGLELPAGKSTLNGDQALALVRARYGIGDGSDLGRIRRQQQFLGAVVRRAKSTRILLNPPRLFRFLDTATRSLTTGGLGLRDLKSLADRLKGLDPAGVTFTTVPTRLRDDRATLDLQQPAADALFASLRPATSPQPAPADVRVRVLNGTRRSGLAARAAGDLRRLGFHIDGIGDAPRRDLAATTVRYGPGAELAAQAVIAGLPGTTGERDQSLGGAVNVVVGNDYRTYSPGAASPDANAASAAAGTATAADDPCR